VTTVAILGAGAGGTAAAVELAGAGHHVRLWNRNPATLAPHLVRGGVESTGLLGNGFTELPWIGTSLAEAIDGADVAVVCLPALAHEALADDLAALSVSVPLILNPGHTGGALHVAARFGSVGRAAPPIVEFSTLSYVARKNAEGVVSVTGRAGRLGAAVLPTADAAADAAAMELARSLWPAIVELPDVIATSLSNVNLVLHPPAAVLGLAWVEATGGSFRFYAEGTTPAVARVMTALDAERREVARAYGHELPPLLLEMAGLGTVDPLDTDMLASPTAAESVRRAVSGGAANAAIAAPADLAHRYYREDFAYGVVPLTELAAAVGVPTPVANALLVLADSALEGAVVADGLTLDRLGGDIRARLHPEQRNKPEEPEQPDQKERV
jgi:opine dehydrogenase